MFQGKRLNFSFGCQYQGTFNLSCVNHKAILSVKRYKLLKIKRSATGFLLCWNNYKNNSVSAWNKKLKYIVAKNELCLYSSLHFLKVSVLCWCKKRSINHLKCIYLHIQCKQHEHWPVRLQEYWFMAIQLSQECLVKIMPRKITMLSFFKESFKINWLAKKERSLSGTGNFVATWEALAVCWRVLVFESKQQLINTQ